ncbi:Rho guanine nucleotide exchange factor 2 [Saguinus oedipus]|uniref:Rho guanine nucleotide exchange factor 2 n=1 Tax=Saguinus oedipus TaxID=9490 RepID=A0ABQ9VK64_SAGOE|nr:Rho guanine nucleotide exchange factor 2 [Saguinus oedipus]
MSRIESLTQAQIDRSKELASKAREKEKMKEAKDARYTNGHLFTTISVSGMTVCYACNKSITAKEALICPTCNVTIHNRCKDTLANCTKVKQKQQKVALLKNNTALQSVSLRSKTTIRERPSSAIYPSDSFRQSLLGSRRGRSFLSLAKSVSTTNIAGHFNDESPLGLRRILSQSTDSLNMRNRTLSVESLIDESAEVIYKVTRSTVLKRHGVQECILLVTQRITKYPVLLSRILQHSHGVEEERQDLTTALGLVKELLSNVDQDVHELEKGARLQEIYNRVDQNPVPSKGPFGREELLQRKLIHDGCLLWKTATGRFKDVLMLLMTDALVFLQEKDQKYIFPTLDKPSVVSLQNLIVRDIANQEKGMFLISAAPPEMYEVHTASRDVRSTWIRVIQQTVRICPSREDFPLIETEDEAYLRRIKMELQQKDRALVELLREKVGLFAEMTHFQAEEDGGSGMPLPTLPRGLFRSESLESPRGEQLLQDAI